ncbi:hypothetical protein [Dysgonomonas sp. Marseille-P4361]|uniref:hypothetical protein n=1 Tax=Dysgonomonas sp. Marseille-P4361 TaxID=2161820 RepID=UPI000D54E274|nr:hypothetical protein [Dysgonomonas sp. Marseille-P4361]
MNYNSNQKHSKEIKIIENIINSDSSHISIYQNNKLLSEGQIFRKGRKNCISTPIYLKEMEEVEIKNQEAKLYLNWEEIDSNGIYQI